MNGSNGARNWWDSPLAQAEIPPPTAEPMKMREAAGTTIDVDEADWRRLSGDGMRDLLPMTQDRMQRIAHYLWEANLLANRIIEIPLAYLLAQGVAWRVDDEDAQKGLTRHWNDGINCYDIKLTKKVRELALFGEQCYPVFRDELTGFVRLGYLDPSMIQTVVTDPGNIEQSIGIVTRADKKGNRKKYRIIVNEPETAFATRTQEIRATFTDGDCFYFRVNDLCSATRGRSDLLAQADFLDAYDGFLFGEIERAVAMRAYLWDVTLTGASPADVDAKAKKIAAPRSGAVRVHNEAETWKAEAPDMKAYDAERSARLFRNHMLGGATIPEHWFGGAENVNRASGESMTEPTEKMLDMRQKYVGYMLKQIATYVLRARWHALDRELKEAEQVILDTLKVEWPELTAKDTTKYAAALQQLVAAVAIAIAEGLLSQETALRIIAAMAERLGVEIDVEEELKTAKEELAARGGNNLDGLKLTVPPVGAVPPADAGTGGDAAAA